MVKIKIVSSNGSASASVGGPNSDLTSDESVSRPLTAIATATATNKVLIDPTQQSLPIMSKISVTAQGGKDELEAMAKALKLTEQGKVYVKGAFE